MKWELPHKKNIRVRGYMDSEQPIYFQNMTWKQVQERLQTNDIIIIPVGSTENHGPHACLGEDTFLVTRMAEAVAKRTGCTVAQPVWYGSHPYHHLGMPGTIVVDDDDFKAQLRAIMAGFWNCGFRKQILLNGHGQEYVIPSAIHQFGKKYQVPAVIVNLNWYHAIPKDVMDKEHGGPFETPFIHADEVETSFSLALFPEMINMNDAVDTVPGGFIPGNHIDKAGNVYQRPIKWYGQVGMGPIEVIAWPEGCVGKSTLAKAKNAIMGLEHLLDYLVELHDDILTTFPAGKLPDIKKITQRSEEQLKDIIEGKRSIYTLAYPP